jgi:Gas vesicle synthesis protein GvpO
MAASRSKSQATEQTRNGRTAAGEAGPRLGMKPAIESVKAEMAELTGRRVDAVTGVERGDEGWQLTIEIVELERIPASTSVIGSYNVVADQDGHVVEYARTHRYYNNRADDGAANDY